jgi:hypothetical protein
MTKGGSATGSDAINVAQNKADYSASEDTGENEMMRNVNDGGNHVSSV